MPHSSPTLPSKPISPSLSGLQSLCCFLWKDQALTPTGPEAHPVDLSAHPLSQVLTQLYPQMSFTAFAQKLSLWQKNPVLQPHLEHNQLAIHWGFHWSARLEKIAKLLVSLPAPFQKWCEDRKASPKDLSPLLSLENTTDLEPHLSQFTDLQLTRSQGRDILESLVELILLNRDVPNTSDTGKAWQKEIFNARYPETLQRDSQAQLKMRFPQFAQYTSRRHGDRLKHHLSLEFDDPGDGIKKLQGLIRSLEEGQ